MVSTPQRREAADFLVEKQLSQRRACQLVSLPRSSYAYPAHPRHDEEVVECLKKIIQAHPRYGYRRAWATLRRGKGAINHKRVHRLWKLHQLGLPHRPRKRKRLVVSAVPQKATAFNQVWTYDFVFDSCSNGQKLKILTVVEEYSRYCLAIEVATSISAPRVIQILSGLIEQWGVPEYLRSDNGPEFIAQILQDWLKERQIKTIYIKPGSPWQNAYAESFNGKLRDECLNQEWFYHLADARRTISEYRNYYNEQRLHSSLEYQTPAEFVARAAPGLLSPQQPRRGSSFLFSQTEKSSFLYSQLNDSDMMIYPKT